ncbi:Myosin [Hirschfeldia incana]|nr:Myosin [Hirschfeldia incana]
MSTPVRGSAFSDCLANLEMKQDALQAMLLQVEEEKAAVIREGEAQLNKVTSVLVENTQKIISLTSEVDALKENQEILVKCITQNLGFAEGKPVAACLIYKCLLHWKSFELEETNIFDRIIQTIASAIEVPDNNQVLAYWLSNSCMLLKLLQHTFTSATILESRGCMGGGVVSSLDRQMQVDAKYPATLFKQQLIGCLEKIVLLSNVRCSFGDGEYVEAGLAELKRWCVEATDEYVGSAWDELKHMRQAAGFLQVLSIRQLYRISAMYFDDIYDMSSVSSDVISSMMIRLIDDLNDGVRTDFLLEDDLSIPFTVEDISKSMEQVDVNDIDTLQLIQENPSFSFLLTCGEASSS